MTVLAGPPGARSGVTHRSLSTSRVAAASGQAAEVPVSRPGNGRGSREDHRRLLDNIVALATLQGANFVLPLLTLPYLARVLGPQRFGLVAFATSTLQYFVILTDFGFNLSATRSISIHRHDDEAVSRIFSSVLVLKVLLAMLGSAVLAVALLFVPVMRPEWRLFVFAYGLVVGNVLFPVWFFQGVERMRFVAVLTVLSKVIFTALVFALVRADDDYMFVPLLNSTGTIVVGCVSLWLAVKMFHVRLRRPLAAELKSHFQESLGYFASRVSVTLYTTSNVFFLGLASNPISVGLYSSAERLYGAMQGVYSPVTNSLIPYMSRTRNRALFARILLVATVVNAVGCGVLVVFSDVIVRLAFGSSYAGAGSVFALLATAMIFVAPTFLLGYPFLAAFGHASYANSSAIAGSLFHLCGLALLFGTGHLDPRNVAALVVATEALVLLLRIYAVQKTGIWRSASTV